MLDVDSPVAIESFDLKTGTRRWTLYLLVTSVLALCFSPFLITNIAFDWLNFVPALAALYVGFCLVALNPTCGQIDYISRCLSQDPSIPRPRGWFLFSPWLRSGAVMLVALVALEFSLRCLSYHRALLYERQGDLLFTPAPNQVYVEKISLTHSRINDYGLRGGPVDAGENGKLMILCLGDSITYGYGVDDEHTYPARLQQALERKFPGQFSVLNGGVDAYPITLIHQKFLYLWKLGLRPRLVIIGYSFNEGWLGNLVDSDEKTKAAFEQTVRLKNRLRSSATYNLVVENWARAYYDRMKRYMVPGTNSPVQSKENYEPRYGRYLERLLADLRRRNIRPVFLLFCGFNGATGRYDTRGLLQKKFAAFAELNGFPVLRSDEILRQGKPENVDLQPYFIDRAHMNNRGNQVVAEKLAELLPGATEQLPRTP